jgi:hypothetical protein
MDRRRFICSIPLYSMAVSTFGCIERESKNSETPVYTSWMPHPDELPQKPKSRYQAFSISSDQTLSNVTDIIPFINAEGIEGNRYTSIDIDTSLRNPRSRSAVNLKILEYSGERNSLREFYTQMSTY